MTDERKSERRKMAEDKLYEDELTYELRVSNQAKVIDNAGREVSQRAQELIERIKEEDYRNAEERKELFLKSIEKLEQATREQAQMREKHIENIEWTVLLGIDNWVEMNQPQELSTEFFDNPEIHNVKLLYELEETSSKEIVDLLAEQINSPDKFYIGTVNGRRELVFRAPVFDHDEYYVSSQATEDYIGGKKSLKELAAGIYDIPDLVSLTVDEEHINVGEPLQESAITKKVNELATSKGNSLEGQFINSDETIPYTENVVNREGINDMNMEVGNLVKVDNRDYRIITRKKNTEYGVMYSYDRYWDEAFQSFAMSSEWSADMNRVKFEKVGTVSIDENNSNIITLNREEEQKFRDAVYDFFKYGNVGEILVRTTPNSLVAVGADGNLQLGILPKTLLKCHKSAEDKHHGHDLDVETLQDILKEIRNPVMIIKGSVVDSYVLVSELRDKSNDTVIISVQFDKEYKHNLINNISSIYGKQNFKDYLTRQIEGNNLVACNTKKANEMAQSLGLQLPPEETFISFNDTITYSFDSVKKQNNDMIEQYKEKKQERTQVAIESTIDFEDPEIGFVSAATENMPAGTKYRLVTFGEKGHIVPYQESGHIYMDRAEAQDYIEKHQDILEAVDFDEMVYQAGRKISEYEARQHDIIDKGMHSFEFEDGYLYFSIDINDYSYDGLYRIYDPDNGKSREIVNIYDGYREPVIEENMEYIERKLGIYVNEHPLIGENGEEIPREKASIYCEWSEHDAFEGGRVYSVSEFDQLMKVADNEWRELREKEREQYGDEAFEILREQGMPQHQGYAKVKFTVYVPGMETLTLRQDVGDGFGGVINYINITSHAHYVEPLVAAMQQELKNQLYDEFKSEVKAGSLEKSTIIPRIREHLKNDFGVASNEDFNRLYRGDMPYYTIKVTGSEEAIPVYSIEQRDGLYYRFMDIPMPDQPLEEVLDDNTILLNKDTIRSYYEPFSSEDIVTISCNKEELVLTPSEQQETLEYAVESFNEEQLKDLAERIFNKSYLTLDLPEDQEYAYMNTSEQVIDEIYNDLSTGRVGRHLEGVKDTINQYRAILENLSSEDKASRDIYVKEITETEKVLDDLVKLSEQLEIPDISISNYESSKPGQIEFDVNIGEEEIHKGQATFEEDGTVNWIFVDPVPVHDDKEGKIQWNPVKDLKIDWDKVIGKVKELLQDLWKKSKEFMGSWESTAGNSDYSHNVQPETFAQSGNFNQTQRMSGQNVNEDKSFAEHAEEVNDLSAAATNIPEATGTEENLSEEIMQDASAWYLDFSEMEVTDGYFYFTIETPDSKLLTGTYEIEKNKIEEIEQSFRYPEIKKHWKEIRNQCQRHANAQAEYIVKNNLHRYAGEEKMSGSLYLGAVPNLLMICGASKHFQFEFSQDRIRECLEQGITEEQLLNALNDVKNPVMVLQGEKENSFIIVTNYFDDQGFPIMVSVEERQAQEDYESGIEVSGVYGQREFAAYVNHQIANRKVLAVDYNKADALYQSIGEKPAIFEQVISFDESVAYNIDSVKIPPTEKQRTFARQIAETMDIEVPKEFSKEAYTSFIGENVEEFKKVPSHKEKGEILQDEMEQGEKQTYFPEPVKMDLDEYLGTKGLRSPVSDYMLDKLKLPHGETHRQEQQRLKEADRVEKEYQDRRNEAIEEYNAKVKAGEIIPKTETERSLDRAKGHPDLESTQAARRMLLKRGIMTEKELAESVKEWDANVTQLDKTKSQELFMFQGLQLPEAFNSLDFDKSLHQSNSIVKNNFALNGQKQIHGEAAVTAEDIYGKFADAHKQFIKNAKVNRIPVVINAFGGPGSGKSVSCMDICQQLKKLGYNAEYVQEYAKELVYDKNWDMLDGTPEHQFEVLKEQLNRVDRLYGSVDFIVTDSPVLLNGVYNKSLTPEYDNMVTSLYKDFENFSYFVERDASSYQQEGRIQNLEESQKIDQEIKQLLKDKEVYFGTYNHDTIDKVVSNSIISFNRINHIEESASKKQIAYAEKIAKSLGIELPEEKTKAAYKTFISENQEEFLKNNAPLREQDASGSSYQDYLDMVAKNGSTLKDVPQEHYTDELLMAAVSNWGAAIKTIPEERITTEIAMASVQQYGLNLKHVPDNLKDMEVCIEAYISSSGKSIRFTPNAIKNSVKEEGQKRLAEGNNVNPNFKRQLEIEQLQEQGQEWLAQIDNMLAEHESDPVAMVEDIAFAAKFYQYSSKNILLMRKQNPYLTYVASASAFEKMGYHVKENEPALIGRVPVFAKYVVNESNERIYSWNYTPEIKKRLKEGTLKERQSVRKFQFVAAFYDISQTDCPVEDYPSIFHMGVSSELHQEAFDAMKEFAEKTLGFKVMVTDLKSISLRGNCEPDNKIIRINEKLEATMALSTLCHEIAHGIIHTSENGANMSTAQKECEADVMDIMLESSMGLPINESRREHLFSNFHAYKEEQAAKENPYKVSLEKLIDRVQTKVFRHYVEDINYYLNIHLPAEGSQNEVLAKEVVQNIALLDSAYGTTHKSVIDTENELFDSRNVESYQELYRQTKEEYRLNNSFVPKLAVMKSMDGGDFYDLCDVQFLDETTADLIRSYPETITPEYLTNVETGNILALKENVLENSSLYLVTREGMQDVTEVLKGKFEIVENKINCGFDAVTEYECIHNLLKNGIEIEPVLMKTYEHLCNTFGFPKNLENDSSMRLMAHINLVTEGLSQNNRELIAEYIFRTSNYKKAEQYAEQIEKDPGSIKKLLQEMKLVDSYKYMLWTIEEYENNNDVSERERITTGAYNEAAIPVLSENVKSLNEINNSFLLVRKHASTESVKLYSIVAEDDLFRIAYVELNEYRPETVYSTVTFTDYEEAKRFYEQYLETPNTRLIDGEQAESLAELENKENQIALSDITSIGETVASKKYQYEEAGLGEEEALELLRSEIRKSYPENKSAERKEADSEIQVLKDFKKMVSSYGEEHFIELCNLDFNNHAGTGAHVDADDMKESLQLAQWLREQREVLENMNVAGIYDVIWCTDAALDSSVTASHIERALNAVDYVVLSNEFSNLEAEFEGFEEYNNVLATLKEAHVAPDKFCYVDFDAAPGPYLYTSDRAGNIYRKSLSSEWDGSVRDLNVRLKEAGYEICTNLDDFRAYSANNRLGCSDAPEKEKNEAYIRILESTSDILPKNSILSIYDFKNSLDKVSSGSAEIKDDITYKLVTRKNQEIHSYIDTYSGADGQNVYEQLYEKAKDKNPELSRVISKQYYQDQINFNEKHLIKPLLEQLKSEKKQAGESEELSGLLESTDKLKEEIKKLDLSPADAELLKLNAGNINTEQINEAVKQMQMNQQAQQRNMKRRQEEISIL